jgi:hypothetical protein
MAGASRSNVVVAVIGALSAVAVAWITTNRTIASSESTFSGVQADLGEIEPRVEDLRMHLDRIATLGLAEGVPIGTTVPSMQPPDAFAMVVGDPPPDSFDPRKSRWVLADGQQDVSGSRYGNLLYQKRPPDLRGMFLRGINEGRSDGRQDPQQDRAAGDYQADALQDHHHQTDATAFAWSDKSTDYGYTSKGAAHAPLANVTNVTDGRVADETRPRNVAVYFYIKIN